MSHRFPYCWSVEDLKKVNKHNHKVFSTFSCGGGSSFGYKMSGYDVIGCNEIDPEMISFYKANHKPKHAFLEPIQEFKNREDLPEELFNLDILDGSPPCSTFSLAGSREKAWGKDKKFREGQAEQVLSDLFFDYLDLVEKLMPKICIAENVKGMVVGKAKGYCKLVVDRFKDIGYDVQLFLLNSAKMGVPQARERVFFIARRKDLDWKPLKLIFDEKILTFRSLSEDLPFQDLEGTEITSPSAKEFWVKTRPGENFSRASGGSWFNSYRLSWDKVCPTVTASTHGKFHHPDVFRYISWIEYMMMGSYPYDYDFLGKSIGKKCYVVGMSVPPVMTAHIAAQIAEQWLDVSSEQIDEAWK